MLLDRGTRKKLAELARQTGQDQSGAVTPPAEGTANDIPGRAAAAPRARRVGDLDELHGPLADLLPGLAHSVREGEYYELRTPVSAHGDWAVAAIERWLGAMRAGHLATHAAAAKALPEGVVFMDTETTGLNNEPLFLVGLLSLDEGEPVLTQLLARHYGEEPAVLAEAARRLHAADLLVTYNGASFDVPYVRNRLRYHRLSAPRFAPHLDLLPVARRRLGRSLGNCRLQTLELHLCGRQRVGDIAGADIPQAYHDFVADGDAARLRHIVNHNSLDLLTLAELAAHLSEPATG
jgi:uncharacterized protein YprB with RNaseH-like and TPR domain